MKQLLICLSLCVSSFNLSAQQIPNPGFDSVYIGGIDRIFQWITADGFTFLSGGLNDTIYPTNPDTLIEAEGFMLSEMVSMVQVEYLQPFQNNSLKLTSSGNMVRIDGSPFSSFLISGECFVSNSMGYPDFGKSGNPFPYRPDTLKGFYMFSDSLSAVDNWGRVFLLLTKYNPQIQSRDTIAFLNSTVDLNPVDTWTAFQLGIPYFSGEIPDSIALAFFASALPDAFGVLWLDEISFTYDTTTSISNEVEAAFRIFPVPATHEIHVESSSSLGRYMIQDPLGRIWLKGDHPGKIQIETLPAGVYFLKVQNREGSVYSVKFVKE